ncbi:hypothetical protein [Halopiger xanaduensis]|uniref:Zinc-ribbon domain-containing protein n=1 Tax=Halopiger xanaduensis (strain DSM 18323 / JCM 14033 / SH-6) TaxID=797210 RepID=F8D5F9_HALXS|nr:hypothetical protein [Halopiger xanaduensis]AEH37665.1 hypothetical protein Halxa_3050 [Halopiger xanaduensis SH-6]
MSISRLLSELFTDDAADSDSPSGPDSAPGTGDERETDGRSTTVLHECRNCGTNVDADATACPACGSDDIVTYSID